MSDPSSTSDALLDGAMAEFARDADFAPVDGILLDLGLSSDQLADRARHHREGAVGGPCGAEACRAFALRRPKRLLAAGGSTLSDMLA
jgi:hypothetical protein